MLLRAGVTLLVRVNFIRCRVDSVAGSLWQPSVAGYQAACADDSLTESLYHGIPKL
jgi:hypothetical protein